MDKLPYEIKLKIISFLPILSKQQKLLHSFINNYNYYFIKELLRLNIDIETNFKNWSALHLITEEVFNITMFQMQKFYLYSINLNSRCRCS